MNDLAGLPVILVIPPAVFLAALGAYIAYVRRRGRAAGPDDEEQP